MFGKSVQAWRYKAPAAVTACALGALGIGCSDPVALTDLRPEGDPEVLSVLVMNDSADQFLESATFCAIGDVKRPGFVGTPVGGVNVCDDDLTKGADKVPDAVPTAWYVRVMFDELLDPNIEELLPILDPDTMAETGTFTGSLLNTQPVVLKCGGNVVAYDGYYSPSGNSVTWPVGPSLVMKPIDPSTIATGSDCTVELKDVITDKTFNPVPTAQRGGAGEYKWSVAALAFVGSSPAPAAMAGAEEVITPDTAVVVTFNGFIDASTLATSEVTIKKVGVNADGTPKCDDPAPVTILGAAIDITADAADPLSLDIGLNNTAGVACTGCVWQAETGYIIEFTDTNAVADLAGGMGALPGAADFSLCFVTDVAP